MTRRDVESWIDKAFWFLLVGVTGFGVKSIHRMSDSVADLSTKMAVIVSQVESQGRELSKQGDRIYDIEGKLFTTRKGPRP